MSTRRHRPARTRADRPGPDRDEPEVFLAPLGISATTVHFGLLIRGFGVRVPGSAPVLKALTWRFPPVRSLLHVHSGRLWARGVVRRRWRFGVARTGWTERDENAALASRSSARGRRLIGVGAT